MASGVTRVFSMIRGACPRLVGLTSRVCNQTAPKVCVEWIPYRVIDDQSIFRTYHKKIHTCSMSAYVGRADRGRPSSYRTKPVRGASLTVSNSLLTMTTVQRMPTLPSRGRMA